MKLFTLILFLLSTSAFACDHAELRKEVFKYFREIPVSTGIGDTRSMSVLKEVTLTDNMLRVRGENFFVTKMIFEILWAKQKKETREVLMVAVVDLAACKIESYESGDILGSSISGI